MFMIDFIVSRSCFVGDNYQGVAGDDRCSSSDSFSLFGLLEDTDSVYIEAGFKMAR